jgi:hypothetical protein
VLPQISGGDPSLAAQSSIATYTEETGWLEERSWGRPGTKNRHQVAEPSPEKATGPVAERWEKPLKCRQSCWDGAAQESNLPSLGLPDLAGFEDHADLAPTDAQCPVRATLRASEFRLTQPCIRWGRTRGSTTLLHIDFRARGH